MKLWKIRIQKQFKMKNKRIELERLLTKFDEGQTSYKEEERINSLLKEVDEGKYDFYKQYFDAKKQEKHQQEEKSTIDFSFIDLNKETSLKSQATNERKSFLEWKELVKIAAVVCILIGGVLFGNYQQTKMEKAQAELAFEQTIQALNFVGSKMNTAKEKVEYIELFNEKTKPYINFNQK